MNDANRECMKTSYGKLLGFMRHAMRQAEKVQVDLKEGRLPVVGKAMRVIGQVQDRTSLTDQSRVVDRRSLHPSLSLCLFSQPFVLALAGARSAAASRASLRCEAVAQRAVFFSEARIFSTQLLKLGPQLSQRRLHLVDRELVIGRASAHAPEKNSGRQGRQETGTF